MSNTPLTLKYNSLKGNVMGICTEGSRTDSELEKSDRVNTSRVSEEISKINQTNKLCSDGQCGGFLMYFKCVQHSHNQERHYSN